MIISGLFFCLLMAAEVNLFKANDLPTSILGWIGNLFLPAVSVIVFFLGNKLRK